MPSVHPQPQSGRKRRRFARHNPNLRFVGFFMIVILLFVAALIWVMSSPRFFKP
jgi:hypothetical protein